MELKPILKYYAFDWDDNILNMPTPIHMDRLINGDWVPISISTSEFADIRNSPDWRIRNNNFDEGFSEFRDYGERGNLAFLKDTIYSIRTDNYGDSWDDFVECLSNGSLFAIITARGHESESIRLAVEWIINNELSESDIRKMYGNLIKFDYLFKNVTEPESRILKGTPSKNPIIKEYLDRCSFIGVSAPSRSDLSEDIEVKKRKELKRFIEKANRFAGELGTIAKVGFSDDDSKNVKLANDLANSLNHEEIENITEFVIKETGPKPSKKVKNYKDFSGDYENLTETSHQTPGLESSVMSFRNFNNMTNRLYPSDERDRQDDFKNKIKREVDFLTKNYKEIRKESKRKKIR